MITAELTVTNMHYRRWRLTTRISVSKAKVTDTSVRFLC